MYLEWEQRTGSDFLVPAARSRLRECPQPNDETLEGFDLSFFNFFPTVFIVFRGSFTL